MHVFEIANQFYPIEELHYIANRKYRLIGAIDQRGIFAVRPVGGREAYYLPSQMPQGFFSQVKTSTEISGLLRIDPADFSSPIFRPGDALVVKVLREDPPYTAGETIIFQNVIKKIFECERMEHNKPFNPVELAMLVFPSSPFQDFDEFSIYTRAQLKRR